MYICVTYNPILNISKRSKPAKLNVQGELMFSMLDFYSYIYTTKLSVTCYQSVKTSPVISINFISASLLVWINILLMKLPCKFLLLFYNSYLKELLFAGVPKRLQIIQGPDNITVAMAAEVSMHCTVRGFPVPMVHWFKDGCPLTNCSASFSLYNNGQLLTFRSNKRNIHSLLLCFLPNFK